MPFSSVKRKPTKIKMHLKSTLRYNKMGVMELEWLSSQGRETAGNVLGVGSLIMQKTMVKTQLLLCGWIYGSSCSL